MKKLLSYGLIALAIAAVTGSCKKDPKPEPQQQEQPYYRVQNLMPGELSTQQPHQVNMLFIVYDKNHKGVPGLYQQDKYDIQEDGAPLSVEANPVIDTFGSIPFDIKTVILLDISSSVQALIPQLKQAAIEMVNNKSAAQEIAIYTFDSKSKLLQNFTKNKNLLINAINSIPESGLTSSTNIYGSLIDVSNIYEDEYTLNHITQGSIVLFTDGRETTDEYSLSQAKTAVKDKKVFVLGLKSSDLDEGSLRELSSDNQIVYANDISEVKAKFMEIQNDIVKLSKSVYWLYYQSPKRGNKLHSLTVKMKNNTNTGTDAQTSGTYSSANFTD